MSETGSLYQTKFAKLDQKQKTEDSQKGYIYENRRETNQSESNLYASNQNSIVENKTNRRSDIKNDPRDKKPNVPESHKKNKLIEPDMSLQSESIYISESQTKPLLNNYLSTDNHPTLPTRAETLTKVGRQIEGLEKLKFLGHEDKEEIKDFIRKEINSLRIDIIKELELQKYEISKMISSQKK